MVVRECGLFAERGGEPGAVFFQTGIDLPRVFLWLLQLPLVLIPLGRVGRRDKLHNIVRLRGTSKVAGPRK